MNHNLRHNIIKRPWLIGLINQLFRWKNQKTFLREVNRRRLLSIFEYKELVQPLSYAPTDMVIDNNLYGLSYCLKKYAGVDVLKDTNATIEHGVFFGNLVREDDTLYCVDNIITFGDRRVMHLQNGKINKRIVPIGPYIHYAEPVLSKKEFEKIKSQLGRTLLVFPSHSVVGASSNFSIDTFIEEIEKVKYEYDTVIVSLFWIDANNPDIIKKYSDLGYKIVTSGHRYDLSFLSRQRSIIELSDYTMSNSLGTHVGYCIYLNKPHYIFNQDVNMQANSKKSEKHLALERNEVQVLSRANEMSEVSEYFYKYSNEITEEQREIVDKIWGTSHIKTSEELKAILV